MEQEIFIHVFKHIDHKGNCYTGTIEDNEFQTSKDEAVEKLYNELFEDHDDGMPCIRSYCSPLYITDVKQIYQYTIRQNGSIEQIDMRQDVLDKFDERLGIDVVPSVTTLEELGGI